MHESDLRRILQIEMAVLEAWVNNGWLVPLPGARGQEFTDADIARGRLILDLTHGMGVNEAGVDVTIALIDQIHGLRQTLRGVMRAVNRRDGDRRTRLIAEIIDID